VQFKASEICVYGVHLEKAARFAGVPSPDWEDVVQTTYMCALDQMRRGLYRGEASLASWLRIILRGKIADYWRQRGSTAAEQPAMDTDEEGCEEVPNTLLDLENTVMVQWALDRIPARHRQVLLWNCRDGLTTREISLLMGRSPGRVGAILADSKQRMRALLR
jgi:RNA polymerase sigma factor (sigma-70 family)